MKTSSFQRLAGFFLLMLFSVTTAFAQSAEAPEMADALRANGKIYVVAAVVGVIVAGLLLYLISLDRKVSKLEQQIKK
ncbi:CcmD family protein [Hymenobacter sp. BT683]|uniref:CcmD family protein n=1 Tax=Hymenobacter jeongseonensis TaxID=2791027 RepID=A0ABS0IH06_9BACT|nr:CcmD family protein [Hymenobacter jeongseonensis]MBF9237080.1 CcmD family protein [Hymenobacter jeongseonensis]